MSLTENTVQVTKEKLGVAVVIEKDTESGGMGETNCNNGKLKIPAKNRGTFLNTQDRLTSFSRPIRKMETLS